MSGADIDIRAGAGPIGLDRRPRPASVRARIRRGLIQSAPFSSLQRRIIFFNLIGLALLVLGVLYLNQFRTGLIEQRVEALRTQGEIVALTLGDIEALRPGAGGGERGRAASALNRLTRPAGLRARLYDGDLKLVADTGALQDRARPQEADPGPFATLEQAYLGLVRLFRAPERDRTAFSEERARRRAAVEAAAAGDIVQTVHLAPEGEPVVSVALPVRSAAAVAGVLVMSTEGDDINSVVRRERAVILQVFVVATLISVALSVLLANTIASPIRRLADAADPAVPAGAGAFRPERVEIPDLTERTDEIGDLSAAMMRMTHALYRRIEAIESFAADVAHEIKNPLTSLRSAIETLPHARTPDERQRLAEVIKHDVGRLDRLVTDISNASRLDAELVREQMNRFDLGELVRALAGMAGTQGAMREVRVFADLPEQPLMVRGLENRLAQVITNLLDNALSFSSAGGTVWIEARRRADGRVRIEVLDEGPGIPEESLDAIFSRFYSERPGAEGFGNHSGLGLSISRQIVEAHGGRIWAENRMDPGARPLGARFVVELAG